jgi:hypothetical protein
MENGKAYLFFCGDWHAFVGRVVSQVGPFTYQLTQVSKINDTHAGDNWETLAAGDAKARKACEYRHYTTPVFLPLTIAAVEWVGEVPQEMASGK